MNHIAPAAETALPELGAPFEGGFYGGIIENDDGSKHALILPPMDEGESEQELTWEQAKEFCAALRIGGKDDWTMPTLRDMTAKRDRFFPDDDQIYPAQTKVEAFKKGGPEAFQANGYWTITEFSAGYAWVQYFFNGDQLYDIKRHRWRVRAVRKYPL
ncbi:MAG: DUF1566 domain-containing protein [Rhodospirillales bacterium]